MIVNDEQQGFAAAVRDFCRREVGTRERRHALTGGGRDLHSDELYKKAAGFGWWGVSFPEEYGGSGGGLVDQCILFEEMYRGMAPVAGAGSSQMTGGTIKRFGSEELKREILGGISAGAVMSISISEPEAGSDVSQVACRAVRSGDGYVINGQKTWCSYAHFADFMLLIARTDPGGPRHSGLTMFAVGTNLPGIEMRRIGTIAGDEVNDVFYTDVRVPADRVVGREGEAWSQLMAGLNGERLIVASQGIGMAQRVLDDLLAYVKERRQFGRPVGTFQALKHRIADLATEVECCRAFTYDVAQRLEAGHGEPPELARLASMAKLKVSETGKRVALEGVQMMGGYGLATEYDMEFHLRQALVPPIYAGTNEIQREIIANSLGLR